MRWWRKPPTEVDIIAFGAHPDDIELLAGGSVAKECAAGKSVLVVDATESEMSSNGTVEQRQEETAKASEILGLKARVNLQFGDGFLTEEKDLKTKLVELIRTHAPKLVLGPPDICRHPDHRALNRALSDAVYFSGLKNYLPNIPSVQRPKLIKYFEVGSGTPDLLVDITECMEIRRAAIAAYESQFELKEQRVATFINTGFLDQLERRLLQWGEVAGVPYAEPYFNGSPPCVKSLFLSGQ
ncbi:MAG: bacillithiol biosynthesis deacetylase BshB1 [Planctomycetes bacterium]|nr:bacillithiol biosynthesis deacetylase BshB1 [Planctomycetota bacterium]